LTRWYCGAPHFENNSESDLVNCQEVIIDAICGFKLGRENSTNYGLGARHR
jgi:hypothetical protein